MEILNVFLKIYDTLVFFFRFSIFTENSKKYVLIYLDVENVSILFYHFFYIH